MTQGVDTALLPPWLVPVKATVRLRVLGKRKGTDPSPVLGVTVPVSLRRWLKWQAGDLIQLHVTKSGRLLVEKVE